MDKKRNLIQSLIFQRLIAKQTIVPMDRKQLESHLLDIKGAKLVGLISTTEPRMRKTGNPYVGTVKVADRRVLLNFNYDDAILRRLISEGKDPDTFVGGSSWHVPMTLDGRLTPLAMHKNDANKHYLRCEDRGLNESFYVSPTGDVVNPNDLQPFIQTSGYNNQGLDRELKFLCFDMNNVIAVTDNKVTYLVRE